MHLLDIGFDLHFALIFIMLYFRRTGARTFNSLVFWLHIKIMLLFFFFFFFWFLIYYHWFLTFLWFCWWICLEIFWVYDYIQIHKSKQQNLLITFWETHIYMSYRNITILSYMNLRWDNLNNYCIQKLFLLISSSRQQTIAMSFNKMFDLDWLIKFRNKR